MSQEDNQTRPGYLVKRVQQQVHRNAEHGLRPIGLTMSQYAVLRNLADHPEVSSAQLARLCFVTRQSLGDVLGGLSSAGLVTIAAQASTGRARPVKLTASGSERLRSAERIVTAVERQMLGDMKTEERSSLVRLLQQCAENLGS